MHNIQAVFFDLDGTLIDPDTHEIPQSNIDVLQQVAEKGILLFVATGRSYHMLEQIPKLLDIPWIGFICSNGQRVFDGSGKEIKSHYFTKQQIDELVAFCKQEGMALQLVTTSYPLAPLGISDYTVEAHSFFDEPLPEVIKNHRDEDVYMALIYNHKSYDFFKVEQIEGLRALPNQSTYADVVLKGISKASGIALLCEKYGIELNTTMAFGDGGNDIDMLQAVKIGVAMGNGSEDVKAISTFVTKAVSEDGITYALENYQLI